MFEMAPRFAIDAGTAPEQLLADRIQRLEDAIRLEAPDRVPIFMPAGHFLAGWGGITHQELTEDRERHKGLLVEAAEHFQPDSILGLFIDAGAPLALGCRMTKWPGRGVSPDVAFQFVEDEYMTADDYDAFLTDPSDWIVRTYLPRAFTELEGFAELPPLGMAGLGVYNLLNAAVLQTPPLARALEALAQAAAEQAEADAKVGETMAALAEVGVAPPPLAGALVHAPFDFMSDTLRGMRGIMLDVHRRPDQLLEAQERVIEIQAEFARGFADKTGLRRAFIPLHRGSDGFLSLAQFERFYWPQLEALITRLVDAEITPFVYYEGVWDDRLDYVASLPRAKTVGWFQFSDVFKVKEIVGDTMCLMGGMRNSLLQAGTVDEVHETTRQLCEVVGDRGGYIMAPSIGEMDGCRPELVEAWVDATRVYGAY